MPRGRSGGVAGRALGASVGYEVRCGLVGHDHGWVQRLSAVGIDRSIDRGRAPASPSCRCCAALRCVAGDGARDVALWTMGDGKQSTMYCTSNVGVGEVMNDPFEPMNIHIVFELAEATFSYPTTAISISDYTIAFAFAFAFDGSFPRFCEGTHALHQCQQVGVPKRPPLPRGNPHRDLLDPRRRSVGVRLAFGWRSVVACSDCGERDWYEGSGVGAAQRSVSVQMEVPWSSGISDEAPMDGLDGQQCAEPVLRDALRVGGGRHCEQRDGHQLACPQGRLLVRLRVLLRLPPRRAAASLPPRPSCCCRLRSHAGALGLVVVRALRAGLGWLPLPALRRRRAPPRGRRPATRALSLSLSLSMRAWPTGCAWRCAPPRAPSSPRPPLPSPSPRMSSRPARCRTSRWPRSPRPRCACSGQSRRSWAAPAFGTTWCDARGWRRWP